MRRAFVALAFALVPLLFTAPAASAHPLGNFTVNRYAGVHLSPGHARVDYVVDMAEIPTFQQMETIDDDGDGDASEDELAVWATSEAASIAGVLELSLDGAAVSLVTEAVQATLVPGQGGLDTLRLEVTFTGTTSRDEGSVAFVDRSNDARVGWREVTISGEDGVAISNASVPSESVSDELRAYPNDLLSSPLDVTWGRAGFAPGTSGAAGSSVNARTTARPGIEAAPLAGVLANHGAPLVVLGLLLALAVGAWHALLPGHGKTLMAAAMVGSGAGARQASGIAAAVALMHTASVLTLGIAVLALERTFRPEVLYPWLGVASGLAAFAVGAYLLRTRWGAWRHRHRHMSGGEPAHDAGHPHEHGAGDISGHGHGDAHGHTHGQGDAFGGGQLLTRRGVTALAFAGGILPAPSALLVMLGAIQAHRVAYGLSLVAAFSAGLAIALLGVGLGALRARDAVSRRLSERAAFLVPVVSAAAILLVGVFLTVRAASQV
jgi:nickel/cobalt transporter (NicO) family protein